MTANDRPPAIFLVTGSMASGKSTVGPLLAARFERAVCIEGDVFRRSIVRGREEMTPQPSEEALAQLRLRYAIAAAAAVAYVDAGFTAVVEDVVAGPLLEEFTRLVVRAPLHVVVLLPSVEVIAAREADRGGGGYTAWLPAQLHDVFANQTPRVGLWLDTSELGPHEVVDAIVAAPEASLVPRRGTDDR